MARNVVFESNIRWLNTKLCFIAAILIVMLIIETTRLYIKHKTQPELLEQKYFITYEGHNRLSFKHNVMFKHNVTSAKDGVWQTVSGTKHKFFVYSAYYDWRGSRMVRVIGATKSSKSDVVFCIFWYNSSNDTMEDTVQGVIKVINENWFMEYSACFVLCPLQDNVSVPYSVSIVKPVTRSTSNNILVKNAYPSLKPQLSPPSNKLAVCVKPLHLNYNQNMQMIEFIEMNTLLGIHHFIFYNASISPTTSCILNHYVREGRATVLQWKLDLKSMEEIRTEGMFAALNDCLYRTMYRFSYLSIIDMDEIIMPQFNDTIQQLIEWIGIGLETSSVASYLFQNAFFYVNWPDDYDSVLSDDPFESGLVTLRKTRRTVNLNFYNDRSKYICRPEFVIEAGNHFVWEYIPGHGTLFVPSHVAILNHYRVCEGKGGDCLKSQSVIDRTAYRYKTRLVENFNTKWSELIGECSLPELENA